MRCRLPLFQGRAFHPAHSVPLAEGILLQIVNGAWHMTGMLTVLVAGPALHIYLDPGLCFGPARSLAR